MKLRHKNTGRIYTFVRSFIPQFTDTEYIELINEKTGEKESYVTAGVIAFFEVIEN